MGKSYWLLLVLLIVFAPIYTTCFFAASVYNNYEYNKAVDQFNNGLLLDKPIQGNLPREFNIVYNDINQLSDHNNIFLIGSSTVMYGLLSYESTIPENWSIHNMAIGGGVSVSEMMLMINYLNSYANHKPDKSDVIVIHIFYPSFKVAPENEQYITQIIEAYGVYSIDKNLQVHGYMPDIYREWMSSKETIRMAIDSFTGINMFSFSGSLLTKLLKISNNITNFFLKTQVQPSVDSYNSIYTYHSPAQIVEYKDFWTRFTASIPGYPNSETEKFKDFLAKLNSQTNVIVVNMYLPSWQRDIEKQKGYEEWMQSDLVPFLEENQIAYVDFSNSFKDEEYADSGHLNKAGREHFTKLFDDAIKPILTNIYQTSCIPSGD